MVCDIFSLTNAIHISDNIVITLQFMPNEINGEQKTWNCSMAKKNGINTQFKRNLILVLIVRDKFSLANAIHSSNITVIILQSKSNEINSKQKT